MNGKPVKEYLAAGEDRFGVGFGALIAHDLDRLQRRQAKVRKLTRKARAGFRDRIDGLLTASAEANGILRSVIEGLLSAFGYRKHHRGEWRMRRDLDVLRDAIEKLKQQAGGPKVLVRYEAPAADAEAVEVFAKARDGDAAAQAQIHTLIRDRKWSRWLGDLGRQATYQLIHTAAGGDPVWKAGITEKADELRRELLGDRPSALEELLVRRVVNGWVTTHVLELELTIRPPQDLRDRDHLDAALTRAQKRFAEAVRELARVRRLQAPRILAQLNVAASQTVLNPGGSGATGKV